MGLRILFFPFAETKGKNRICEEENEDVTHSRSFLDANDFLQINASRHAAEAAAFRWNSASNVKLDVHYMATVLKTEKTRFLGFQH